MFAIQNIKTGKFCTAQTTDTVLLTSVPATRKCSLTALSQKPHTTFWVKRECGKDYRIVVLKSVEVKRVIDYYESKTSFNTKRIKYLSKRHLPNYLRKD